MTRKLHQKNRAILGCVAVAVCMLGIVGCKKEQPPAAAPAQPVKVESAPAKPVQKPISSALRLSPSPSPANQFDFSSKKDPFKPAVFVKAVPLQSAEDVKKTSKESLPIHNLDVDKFTLIGIITGGKENRAMVTDLNKKGYVLKVGMKIGNNDGVVTSITNSGVEVTEKYKDDSGKVSKRVIPLALPKKQ